MNASRGPQLPVERGPAECSPPRNRLRIALVMAGAALLYLPGLTAAPIDHPLEAKYALTAREMLRGGSLIVPHLFGQLYPDKPPLYFWSVASLGWLRGGQIDEVTARLPAAAAALITLLVVYRLGNDLFGPRVGLLSAGILATSALFFQLARVGFLDQFLTMFVTVAVTALWRSLQPITRGRAAGWATVAYAAMGLGVLSKGLVALVVPLLAVATYLAVTGPLRAVAPRLRIGSGLAVLALIVLAWFAPAVARQGTGYVHETVVHQQLVRYVRAWTHSGPWYHYLGEFPVDFFPWILFLPIAIVVGVRTLRHGDRSREARRFLFPLSWFATGFVFFTLCSGKRGLYLLPLYPAAALMVGWLWDRALAGAPGTERWVGFGVTAWSATAALLAGAVVVMPLLPLPGRMHDFSVVTDTRQVVVITGVLVATALVTTLFWWRRWPAATLVSLLVGHAALFSVLAGVRASQREAEFPVRAFAARVRDIVPEGAPVAAVAESFPVAFYVDRPWRPMSASTVAAAGGDGVTRWMLVDSRDRQTLDGRAVAAAAGFQSTRRTLELLRVDSDRR